MAEEIPTTIVYSAIPVPVQVDFAEDDDVSLDLLSLPDKYQSKHDSSDGFIFGLRMGFASQAVLGFVVLFEFHEELSSATEKMTGILLVSAIMCAIAASVSFVSNKLHTYMKQLPQQEQRVDQDFHIYQGTLMGMFLAWILFDLGMEDGLSILGIHCAVSCVGYLYLRYTKECSLRKRRALNEDCKKRGMDDDLLRSLDLA